MGAKLKYLSYSPSKPWRSAQISLVLRQASLNVILLELRLDALTPAFELNAAHFFSILISAFCVNKTRLCGIFSRLSNSHCQGREIPSSVRQLLFFALAPWPLSWLCLSETVKPPAFTLPHPF